MTALAREIERASDAVRAANHSTFRGRLDGPETSVVIGSLVELLDRLPQVLDFLVRSLRWADPAQHYDDRGREPEHALHAASEALGAVTGHLDLAASQLHDAHNALGHLGRGITEED